MKRIGVVSVLTMFACAGLSAGDLFVGPDQTYTTIQAAVDDAGSGDVIHVAEGIYDVGATVDAGNSGMSNRVAIVSKTNLKIVGAGRGKTIVRGSRPAGYGDDFRLETAAVRCLRVQNCSDLVISDMTFERGETWCTAVKSGQNGGAIYVAGTWASTVRFVDCDISDSAAPTSGLVEGGTYVRCRLDSGYGYYSAVADKATFVNCAIFCSATYNNAACNLFRTCSLYNCTIADCRANNLFSDTDSKAVNSLIVLFSGSYLPSGGDPASVLTDCVRGDTAAHGEWQVMAPTLGDMSPLPAADVFGAGTYANLDEVSLPAGISKYVDLNGQPIVADGSGKITAGAVQAAGVPAAGMLVFDSTTNRYGKGFYPVLNGKISKCDKYLSWVCPTSYPVQIRASALSDVSGAHFFRWQRSVDNGYQYASMDGTEWLMPPPDPAAVSCYTAEFVNASDIYYVAEDGDDATGTMNDETRPYASLAAAVESAGISINRIILVKPGYYTNKTANAIKVGTAYYGADCRFATQSQKLLIRSTGGAGVTFIGGAPCSAGNEYDAVNYPGAGSDAIRIAYMRNSCALQGFTLMNSYATGDNVSYLTTSSSVGAPQLLDCVVSNCVSTSYGTSANSTRCRFEKIISKQDVVNGNTAFCFVTDCTVRDANFGAIRDKAIFCTAVGEPNVANLCTSVTGYNSILDGAARLTNNLKPNGCLCWNYAVNNCSAPFLSADPIFVDRGNAPTLGNTSPAVGAGIVPTAENCATTPWYVYCVGDLNNEPIRWTGGKPTIGAAQTTVPCVSIAVPANGGVTFEGAPLGISPLDPTKTIVARPAAGARPCVGITVNGEPLYFTNNWQEATSEYAISVSEAGVSGLSIAALYSNDWYADDDGDDANSGFLPKLAKKTLTTAETMLAGGDTLWVLPGTYDTGSNRVNATETIWSRLVVQNGHTVISTDGPEETVIVGADATFDPDDYGCGTNAIRCATVCRNGTLSGFTLTGGRVNRAFGNKQDGMGGGVIGESANGMKPDYRMRVENCIISNCVAAVGAGATRVQLARSRVLGNRATSYGSGSYHVCQYGCLFAGNIGTGVIDHPSTTIGCTVATDNLTAAGVVATAFQSANNGTLVANTLFCSPISHTSDDNALILSHCAYPDASTLTGALITITDCVETNVESLAIDEAGVPVVGSNAAIDKGDPAAFDDSTYAFLDPAHDLYGFQRVMNGAMDIGCCEGDWSRRYARDLGSARYVTVSDVSPEVVENAEKKIDLPASATLTLTWAVHPGSSAPRILSFVVTSGTLTVSRAGGETVVCEASPNVQTIVLPGDTVERLVLTTSADGAATLLSCRRQVGMMLIIR